MPTAQTPDFAVFTGGRSTFASADLVEILRAQLSGLTAPQYFGVLAYLDRAEETEAAVTKMRVAVRDATGMATVAGFGPRFLHSTGQAYKGGPKTGHFLVVTREARPDLEIPNHRATFGTVQLAQALGDIDVLRERGQRVLRVHLLHGGGGLDALGTALAAALSS